MRYNKIKSLFVFLILVFTAMQVGAEGEMNGKATKLSKVMGSPSRTHFNINNVSTWIYNNGDSDIRPDGNSGFEFPKGSGLTAVFESGFVWGATVNGEKRVGGSTYEQGLLPGSVLDNGEREDETLPHVRIYRVRTDWETGDLSAEINDGEGTEAEIRAQYELDWNEWPAEYGAPYEDVDGNGQYSSDVDIPGFPGADQTIWYVANDLDTNACRTLYGSDPMGVEVQATFWGYKSTSALGNTMFRKYLITNKSADTFEDMYVSMWSDPDVGDAGDDYSGCDVDLSLMYTYNGDNDDEGFYGSTPPAVGFDFFQGPIVPGDPDDEAIFNNAILEGYVNLPMTVHYFFINSDPVYNDPDLGEYTTGTLQFHNLFNGLITTSGQPFTDPTTGEATKYTLAGDPVTGQGWVDGILHAPGDRRQGMVAGPFDMAPGDVQEIVVAELAAGAFGTVDRLGAVQLLKFYDQEAQSAYDNFFEIPTSPTAPVVKVTELDEEVILTWDNETSTAIESYDDLGYTFQGYVVYQYPSSAASFEDATLVATYDLNDGIGKVIGPQFDLDAGVVLDNVLKFGEDGGIQRSISITTDAFNGDALLNNGTPYYFAVTSYAVNEDLAVVPNYLESELIVREVIPQNNVPGMVIEGSSGQGLALTHNGTANATVEVTVVDPAAVTGNNYEIYFDEQHYYLDKDGVWKETNYPDSIGKALAKPGDQSPSTLIPLPAIFAPDNTLDIHLMVDIQAPDYNWVDGVKLTFPDGITINSAEDAGDNHTFTPEIDGQTVTWGSKDTTYDGGFSGGEDLSININFVEPTFSVDYEIWDDGWSKFYLDATGDSVYYNLGGGIVDGIGTVTLTGETGYQFKTEQHWNVRDVTVGEPVLEDQRVFGGTNIYTDEWVGEGAATIFDGLKATVDGNFAAPINFLSTEFVNETSTVLSNNYSYDGEAIVLTNYTVFGGVITSYAIDNFGVGTYSVDELQQDYEIRYTGVFEEKTINGQTVYEVTSGGQMATCFRMISAGALATNPLNPSPGTAEAFLIRVPFEIWNVDDPDNPYQVNFTYRDRERDGTENPFWAWNLDSRMYGILVNTPYDPNQVIQVDGGEDEFNANATWVVVFRKSNYAVGDIVKLTYANPIQLGKDTWTFTAPNYSYDATQAAQDVEDVNVFPNPYYGVNPNEINKYQRFVTFNHLPPRATIRLFNLGGQLVKTINKDDQTQFAEWDLLNENDLPVASGVYIAYIDMPELGKTKILKVAIIAETQILDRF